MGIIALIGSTFTVKCVNKKKNPKTPGFVDLCVGVILQNASRVGKLAFTFTYPFLKNYVSGEMQAKGYPPCNATEG